MNGKATYSHESLGLPKQQPCHQKIILLPRQQSHGRKRMGTLNAQSQFRGSYPSLIKVAMPKQHQWMSRHKLVRNDTIFNP